MADLCHKFIYHKNNPCANRADFSPIGKVNQVNDRSSSTFHFIDTDLPQDKQQLYYRIVFKDENGTSPISSVVEASYSQKAFSDRDIFYNPVEKHIIVTNNVSTPLSTVTVLNGSGQVVVSQSQILIPSPLNINMNSFPDGIYFVTAWAGEQQHLKKILVY